jgi:outer membrane lipoprotein-sorting protein
MTFYTHFQQNKLIYLQLKKNDTKKMKQIILSLSIAVVVGAMASCNQAANVPMGADLDKKIDSIKQSSLEKMQTVSDSLCKIKMNTTVIEKADSLVKAMKETKHA